MHKEVEEGLLSLSTPKWRRHRVSFSWTGRGVLSQVMDGFPHVVRGPDATLCTLETFL